ncbi:MAG: hypothetical protein HRF40_05255 [Nitrososphaera sp.]|jgi:hypothetical protein
MVVRFSKDKNLENAIKQLLEWKILEYVEAGDSYQATEVFREFVKSLYDKWTADPGDSFPFKEGNSSVHDFFAYLIEQYIGVNNALAGKDRTAILAIFASLVQEMDSKMHDERYEN